MKFSLSAFPEQYSLPARPSGARALGLEAHKQTQFLLGDDLALFERAMNVQLKIVAENRKARASASAALVSMWSRVFSHLSDTCTLICAGSYASCPPVMRAAIDCVAVQRSLLESAFEDYEEWIQHAVSQAPEQQALSFDLGRYRAASVLADDDQLGSAYRLLTDLSMPHFGSIALLSAPETGLERMPIAFADQTFHLGWAELIAGWMLLIAEAQLFTVRAQDVLILGSNLRTEIDALAKEIAATIDNAKRCRAAEIGGRFLIHNFRRTASGQPRRVML